MSKERRVILNYKILIAGNNTSVINDLFEHKHANLEFISSSMRSADLLAHSRAFKPDLFIYCLGAETNDNASAIISLRNVLKAKNIPTAIVADISDDDLSLPSFAGGTPELLLKRPITAANIQKKINEFLEQPLTSQFKSTRGHIEDETRDDNSHATFSDTSSLLSMIDAAISNIEAGPKKILVIDDDPAMLKTIKTLIGKQYEIATAISGSLGRRYLEKKHVDLILLDYEMPNEDGPTVLTSLREDPDWQNIPVIFLTGINDVSKIQKALSCKPQGYLLKPIDHAKLLKTIEETLKNPIEF